MHMNFFLRYLNVYLPGCLVNVVSGSICVSLFAFFNLMIRFTRWQNVVSTGSKCSPPPVCNPGQPIFRLFTPSPCSMLISLLLKYIRANFELGMGAGGGR